MLYFGSVVEFMKWFKDNTVAGIFVVIGIIIIVIILIRILLSKNTRSTSKRQTLNMIKKEK